MHVFSEMMSYHHEQVVFGDDPEAGLRANIAIHDTSLGPALGGTRMWPYRSEAEALNDVLRLSRGMTAKAAVARLLTGVRSRVEMDFALSSGVTMSAMRWVGA